MKKTIGITLMLLTCGCLQSISQTNHLSFRYRFGADYQAVSMGIFLNNHAELLINHSALKSKPRRMVDVLYVEHFQLGSGGFGFYAGAGMHFGMGLSKKNVRMELPDPFLSPRRFITGADAILGLEYKMKKLPLLLSADVKPYTDFFNEEASVLQAALSVGFHF